MQPGEYTESKIYDDKDFDTTSPYSSPSIATYIYNPTNETIPFEEGIIVYGASKPYDAWNEIRVTPRWEDEAVPIKRPFDTLMEDWGVPTYIGEWEERDSNFYCWYVYEDYTILFVLGPPFEHSKQAFVENFYFWHNDLADTDFFEEYSTPASFFRDFIQQ